MEPRIKLTSSAGGYTAMLGLEKYLASCGLETNLLNLIKVRVSQSRSVPGAYKPAGAK
ncbi:MAG TPA: hypothetical protein VKK61_05685 [Tepidisphaeraceae bacterium]|nr:hypothetical protein [Tepidisphaeraceae bacterium]